MRPYRFMTILLSVTLAVPLLAQAARPQPGEGVGHSWTVDQSTRAFVELAPIPTAYGTGYRRPLYVTPCTLQQYGVLQIRDTWGAIMALYAAPRKPPVTPPRVGWPWCPNASLVSILPDMFDDRPHPRLYEEGANLRQPLLRMLSPPRPLPEHAPGPVLK